MCPAQTSSVPAARPRSSQKPIFSCPFRLKRKWTCIGYLRAWVSARDVSPIPVGSWPVAWPLSLGPLFQVVAEGLSIDVMKSECLNASTYSEVD